MKFGNLIKAAVAAGALVAACATQASPFYFFGNASTAGGSFPQGCPASVTNCAPLAAQALFTNAVAVSATETFESFAPAVLGTSSLPVFGNATAGLGLSQETPVPSNLDGGSVQSASNPPGGTNLTGRFNTTNGAASGRWFESDYSFSVKLADDVGAIGFFGTDFNDFAGTLEIELLNNGQSVNGNIFTDADGDDLPLRTTSNTAQDGSLIFFGFASDVMFDQIVFRVGQVQGVNTGDQDYLGFDDIMIGNLRVTTPPNPAPEPGSLALVGMALCAAGWARKSQRHA